MYNPFSKTFFTYHLFFGNLVWQKYSQFNLARGSISAAVAEVFDVQNKGISINNFSDALIASDGQLPSHWYGRGFNKQSSIQTPHPTTSPRLCLKRILLNIHKYAISPEDCIPALIDNSSACGWFHKTNFTHNDHQFHSQIAKQLATNIITARICLYAQHFKGDWNVIAGSLSRDFHLSYK